MGEEHDPGENQDTGLEGAAMVASALAAKPRATLLLRQPNLASQIHPSCGGKAAIISAQSAEE